MSYLEEVQNSKDYNNYKLTADKVIQVLDTVREERTKSRRRWIWELMQNAKDAPNIYGAVSVEIDLSESSFAFKHNGDPFLVGNITGLIQQVSYGKPSNSSNRRITGKFGTGFISTHLLSDIVTVEGIVQKEPLSPKKFKIELNRKGETSEELIPTIKRELERLNDIERFETVANYHSNRLENDKPSIFTYPLSDDEAKKAAIVGIEDLSNTLPQTLIFIDDQIKRVKINDYIKGHIRNYERIRFKEIQTSPKIIYATIESLSSSETYEYNFVIYRDDEIDLAIRVDNFDDKNICFNEDSPNLFRDFPLVGTEKFYFPFSLNGTKFSPTEKRDNILLTDVNSKKTLKNREILEYAIEKSKIFVKWLIDSGFKNLSPLCLSRIPIEITEEEVKNWYGESIQKNYRQHLKNLNIVETVSENLNIDDAIIPKISGGKEVNQKFWEILANMYGQEKMCFKEHLDNWHKFLGIESEIETWGKDIFYTLEDLLSKIQNSKTIDNLDIVNNDQGKITWLNSVYKFLIDNKEIERFKEFKIVPNRKGEFKLFDDLDIEKEGNIPDEFISIYKKIKEDWDEILVHRELIDIDRYHSSKSIKDISKAINEIINLEEKNSFGKVQKTFIDRHDALNILKDILKIQPNSSTETFQKKLFNSAKTLFGYEDEPIILNGIQDFNFSPTKKQMIRLINTTVEKQKTIDQLSITNPDNWLNNYLFLLQENFEFKHLLEYGNIVPNEYGEFKAYEDLNNFGTEDTPLDYELIRILKELNPQKDWKKNLKANYISIRLPNTIKFDELANAIQTEIEAIRADPERNFEENSAAILDLINWCKNNQTLELIYFGKFTLIKDNVFVNISLEDESVGTNIVKLLRHKDKLEKLTEIAETGVDLSDLKSIAEISKIVGMGRIKAEAERLRLEKEDFEFKKAIGQKVESSLIDVFNLESLNYHIDYQGIGDKDIIISNPLNGKKYFIELKSLSPLNNDKNIRVSISQGQKAIKCIPTGNYALAVLVRPNTWDNANIEYIRNNLKSILNAGTVLKDAIARNDQFESIIKIQNGISLEFEDERRKIKLAEHYWRTQGKDFDELLRNIKEYLR